MCKQRTLQISHLWLYYSTKCFINKGFCKNIIIKPKLIAIYQALSQNIYCFLRRVLMFYYLKMGRLDNIIQPYLKIFFLIKSDTIFLDYY